MSPRTWFRLVVLSGLLTAMGLGAPGWSEPAKGKKYALLVGVKTYKRSTHFPDLKYTENDVEKLAPLLKKGGFASVRVLTSKRGEHSSADAPTAANIKKALAALIEDRGPRDTVLVALSGHGVEVDVPDPDGEGKNRSYGYFCPSDADLVNISYSTGRSKTLLHLGDLFDTLGKCGAGAKLILVDACRNELKADSSTRRPDVDSVRIPRGVGALFSCSSGQKAFETKKLKHGVFFHFVLEGLKGAAKNHRGEVSWSSLSDYVTDKVTDEVPALVGGGARQTPHPFNNIPGKSPVLLKVEIVRERPKRGSEAVVKEKTPKEIENSIDMKLVLIPSGKFKMGSPSDEEGREPSEDYAGHEHQHDVAITKPFYLGVHAVTQAQFRKVMGYNPSYYSTDGKPGKGIEYVKGWWPPGGGKAQVKGEDTDNFPVENVSWEEATTFLEKLSALPEEKKKGRKYRLPTEAEWEYASRAGTTTAFHVGDSLSTAQANFGGDPQSPRKGAVGRTCKVGSYKANAFGLFDVHGNVRQWCSDWFEMDYSGKGVLKDPEGPARGQYRVIRGGCWFYGSSWARSALRYKGVPGSHRSSNVGFRVVLVVDRTDR